MAGWEALCAGIVRKRRSRCCGGSRTTRRRSRPSESPAGGSTTPTPPLDAREQAYRLYPGARRPYRRRSRRRRARLGLDPVRRAHRGRPRLARPCGPACCAGGGAVGRGTPGSPCRRRRSPWPRASRRSRWRPRNAAVWIAAQTGHEDVQVVGRSLEGLALVHEGLVDEGMRQLDESAVAAKAGDVKDLMWIGKVCCNLISACERVGDVERATPWCAEVKEFAQRWELADALQRVPDAVRGGGAPEGCLDRGRDGAADRADRLRGRPARLRSARARPTSASSGAVRAGWTRRARCSHGRSARGRRGRHRRAPLDEGDATTALALAERLERATEKAPAARPGRRTRPRRAGGRGEPGTGRAALDASRELDGLAEDLGTTGRSRPRCGRRVRARAGDLELARRRLEDAVDLFGPARPPTNAPGHGSAGARQALLGSETRTASEADAARKAFRELDAPQGRGRCGELLERALALVRGRRPSDASGARGAPARRGGPATGRSPPTSSSASTPCTGTSRTSSGSSPSRPARRPPRGLPATASCERRGCPIGPSGPSAKMARLAKPRPHPPERLGGIRQSKEKELQ